MKYIVVFGAGRSATFLLKYINDKLIGTNYACIVIENNKNIIQQRQILYPKIEFVLAESNLWDVYIKQSTIVISLLPPFLHINVAEACIKYGKNLITASYITPEFASLLPSVKAKNLTFVAECGLDPGLDHITTCVMRDEIIQQNGKITAYQSHCGGLVAESSNDNPWGYKISWNPKNVVLAAQGGLASFLENGQVKYLSYPKVFATKQEITLQNQTKLESYKNRDSLRYIDIYQLKNIKNFSRNTLRYPGFCKAWLIMIMLGLTDNTTLIEFEDKETYHRFFTRFLAQNHDNGFTYSAHDWAAVEWLWNDFETIPFSKATASDVLQSLIERKWMLKPGDKDRVVLTHTFSYTDRNGFPRFMYFELDEEGEDHIFTAMSKWVGLPLAGALSLLLNDSNTPSGIFAPTESWIYRPIYDFLVKNNFLKPIF